MCRMATWGTPGGRERNCGQEPLLWFPQKAAGEAGWTGLGLGSLNYFRGLWGEGTVSICLIDTWP